MLVIVYPRQYYFTFLNRANIRAFLSREILRKDIRQLLAIFGFLLLRPRHNAELHGADFFQEHSSFFPSESVLEVIKDRSSNQAGGVSVGFESFEDFVSSDRLRIGPPRIVVRSSSNEGVAKKNGGSTINPFSSGNGNKPRT